jgi:hypothetical protein
MKTTKKQIRSDFVMPGILEANAARVLQKIEKVPTETESILDKESEVASLNVSEQGQLTSKILPDSKQSK